MTLKSSIILTALSLCGLVVDGSADDVPVHHTQGFLHGFLVLKNTDDKILASGEIKQDLAGARVRTVMTLHFRDGSVYEETAVYSQKQTFRLISYKQVEKGPSFKSPQTMWFDTTTGKLGMNYIDKGKEVTNQTDISLPSDTANGIVPLLLANIDPRSDTTLSMVVAGPKPRIVKLKISADGEDSFSVAGIAAKATRYLIKVDLGPVTGTLAKVAGKQPPPTRMWVASGNAPVFLRSEGPLYEDGPIWRIELAAPSWPSSSKEQSR
jgi:hypothetical protein